METKHSDPMTYRIYDELKKHIGKENAISGPALSAKFEISERELRGYINEICVSGELEKIVASGNAGYYLCQSKEDSNKARERLLKQAFSLLRRASAIEKKAGLDGQCKIRLGEYYKQCVEPFAK